MMAYDITIIGARLKACERPGIKEARVLNGTSPYALSFDARTDGVEALGYLVSNHVIRKALYDEVQTLENVDIFPDLAVTAVATNADTYLHRFVRWAGNEVTPHRCRGQPFFRNQAHGRHRCFDV